MPSVKVIGHVHFNAHFFKGYIIGLNFQTPEISELEYVNDLNQLFIMEYVLVSWSHILLTGIHYRNLRPFVIISTKSLVM